MSVVVELPVSRGTAAPPAPSAEEAPEQALDLDKLYRDCHRQAYSVAWAYLRNDDDALDAVQEAFIKAHKAAYRFEERCRPSTWLYRIVANVCIDRLRRRMARCNLEAYDANEAYLFEGDLSSTLLDPFTNVQNQEVRQALAESLKRMSDKHRAIIIMREVMGLTYEEIGQELDCPKGTVMSRLFHARRKLRAMLCRRLGIPMTALAA